MQEEKEKIKLQHIESYKKAIIETIKNNTNSLIDDDIMSLIKKPPLDSMDQIKSKFLDLAKKNNVRQEIVTNAILLDENWINEIVSSNTKLSISIRSVDKINYENLTKGANFNKLIENLKYINSVFDKRHYNFDLSMYTLVTKYNYMEFRWNHTIDRIRKKRIR